ncbi:MAG: tetratricopeptide repeat protein [Bacteroidetes bacterium]|nr:tetratricopeptide repeat protein [Bacteroidota bacterium]
MRIVISILFVCFAQFGWAQNNGKSIEDLKKDLTLKIPDSNRLQVYLDLSTAFRNTDADSALHYATLAYQGSTARENSKYRAEALLCQGVAVNKKGDFKEALKYFTSALKYSTSVSYEKGVASAYRSMGICYYQMADFSLAIEFYQKSISISKQMGDKENIGKTTGQIASIYHSKGDYDKALEYYNRALEIADETHNMEQVALLVNKIGNVFNDKGEVIQALNYYEKSLEIYQKKGDTRGESTAHANIGNVFFKQGKYVAALDAHYKSLRINEKMGNKYGIANSYLTLGLIYSEQKDNVKALDFYNKAMKLVEKMGDKALLSTTIRNIGQIYQNMEQKVEAQEYFYKGLAISKEIGDLSGVAESLNLLGNFYLNDSNLVKAQELFQQYLQRSLELGDKNGIASAYSNVGNVYLRLNNTKEAILNCRNGYNLSKEYGGNSIKKAVCECLYKAFETQGKSDSAYHYFKLFDTYRDSLINNESSKLMARHEIQYEFDKKFLSDSIAGAQQKELDELRYHDESRKQKLYTYMSLGAFVITLILAIGIFTNFRLKQQSNRIIKKQKELVEEKNAEIMSSIRYAQRIQNALLTSDEHWDAISHDHFVYLKPKDVVSGDFYWAHYFSDNKAIWVAADCTGHGVPGAFMSMLGIGFLNEIVVEDNIVYPNEILDRLRTKIINALRQKGLQHQQMDGMDLALCLWDKNTNKLMYSGANNPLWLMRAGELVEIKPDKQPVGFLLDDTSEPFTIHEIQLQKGDIVYTFTDGYTDQFGGKDGKKFKYKRFRDLLKSIQSKAMYQQKESIEEAFEAWKGEHEQVDDVCIIGVKVV